MFRNAFYMIALAAREAPVVLRLMTVIFVTDIGYSVAALFLPKVVIAGIERQESILYIALVILFFTAVITLLKATRRAVGVIYQSEVIACRSVLVNRATVKTLTTSYSNTDEPDFRLRREKALEATSSNWRGTESGYRTITDIVTSLAGFIVFFALLTRVNLLVLLAVSLTTTVSFSVRKRINEWEYANEKEAKDNKNKLWYIIRKGQDHQAAKDIRIFGIGRWLQNLSDDFQRLCFDWERRRNSRHLLGDGVNCLMSFLREGLAYGFLLHIAARDGMAASDFVLDEPTAALDPIAERDLYLTYNEFTEGKTSVFISHRLASTRFCDRIIVIEKGEIIETGSHDALMRTHGRYANLFDLQSRYYRDNIYEGGMNAQR